MDTEKDYYAILGVLPSIDVVALAAVYRALLKKYHPDVFTGSKADAEARTREIIQAYEVIGNSEHRRAYDKAKAENGLGSFRQEGHAAGYSREVAADWEMVKKYYPVTEEMRIDLAKLSQALAFTFQVTVLEEKLAANALDKAFEMENEFLERYFGTNSKIHDYVRDALLEGRRDVAQEVNRAIKVLGTPDEPAIEHFIEQVASQAAIRRLRPGELSLGVMTPDEQSWLTWAFGYLKEIDGLRSRAKRDQDPCCLFRNSNVVTDDVYMQFRASNDFQPASF